MQSSAKEPSAADVVAVLRSRGLLQDVTDAAGLSEASLRGPLTVYCGFDPTADCLHLGNLLAVLTLAWFARCGHRVVALVGGATGRVGDPSGKSAERPVLAEEEIERNTAAIGSLLGGLLGGVEAGAGAGAGGAGQVQVLNNLEWYKDMGFLEFLRDVGKYARVGPMMAKESVKRRLFEQCRANFPDPARLVTNHTPCPIDGQPVDDAARHRFRYESEEKTSLM